LSAENRAEVPPGQNAVRITLTLAAATGTVSPNGTRTVADRSMPAIFRPIRAIIPARPSRRPRVRRCVRPSSPKRAASAIVSTGDRAWSEDM
jgi:hypothetical protein